MFKDTNLRSIVKGISWRLFATITTISIVYIFFGRLDLAIATGLIEIIAKIFLYWAHERVWIKINWGKEKVNAFNISLIGNDKLEISKIETMLFNELKKLNIVIDKLNYNDSSEFNQVSTFLFVLRKLHKNCISTISCFSMKDISKEELYEITNKNIFIFIENGMISIEGKTFSENMLLSDIHISNKKLAIEQIVMYVKKVY